MNQQRIVKFADLNDEWGISYTREHLARLIAAGHFPPPDFRLRRRARAWRPETIAAWLDSQSVAA